jgi:hypothetical protein
MITATTSPAKLQSFMRQFDHNKQMQYKDLLPISPEKYKYKVNQMCRVCGWKRTKNKGI